MSSIHLFYPLDVPQPHAFSRRTEKEVATLAALDAAYKEKQRVAHEAEQDRKQWVEAAERAEAEAVQMAHGSKPIIVDLRGLASAMGRQDGKFLAPSIEPALKERLIDPSSLQWGKLVSSEKATFNEEKCYKVVLTFSAGNRFGGLVPGTATAYVRDETLLELEVSNESTSGTGGWRPL